MHDLPLSVLDIIFLSAIGIAGLVGFFWGFVGLLTSVGSFLGALFITVITYPAAQELARAQFEMQLFADILAGALVFVFSLLGLTALGASLSHLVKESGLGSANRILGFAASIGVGYLVSCFIWLGVMMIGDESSVSASERQSWSYQLVRVGGITILEILPGEFGDYVNKEIDVSRTPPGVSKAVEEENILQPALKEGGISRQNSGDAGHEVMEVLDTMDISNSTNKK